MVGYLPIADEEVQPGAPLLSSLGVRLRDNPIAIAEGWQDAPNVLRKRVRLFTSSGTWTKPAQIRCVEVWVVGGGGGGGAGGSGTGSGIVGRAGGGGGAAYKVINRDDLASSVTVTVGHGGNGGSGGGGTGAPGGPGQNGGTSSFGSHVSATGGAGGGGGAGADGSGGGSPGAGGTGSGGDVNLRGQQGHDLWGGGQGAGPFGGIRNSFGSDATSSQNYGVGGGYRESARSAGRNGSAGVVVVIEYLGGEADQ